MNTIGDAISYAVNGVSYLAETIKYYVRGVPPAIPDDGDIVFVYGVTTRPSLADQRYDITTVWDIVVRPDELPEPAETEPAEPETEPVESVTEPVETEPAESVTESVTETVTESAETEPDESESVTEPAETESVTEPAEMFMPPSLAVRVAYHFVLEELLDTKGQTDLCAN